MIVRESASPGKPKNKTNWPPKSPYDALLSSPSGRKKAQRLNGRSSISPSPAKRKLMTNENEVEMLVQSDEDEETLQLQLQAIEARLKLKKLQKTKDRTGQAAAEQNKRATTPPKSKFGPIETRANAFEELHDGSQVEIPASPKPSQAAQLVPTSPNRVLLGIDKGLKASEVSLKRGYGDKYEKSKSQNALREERRTGFPGGMTSTFNERLANATSRDAERRQKAEKVSQLRSRGFGLKRSGISTQVSLEKDKALGNSPERQSRAKSDSSSFVSSREENGSQIRSDQQLQVFGKSKHISEPKEPNGGSVLYDPHSMINLSKRIIPEQDLNQALEDKETMSIPTLLSIVTAPIYEPPDVEGDYVVLGVIAAKSTPYNRLSTNKVASKEDPEDDAAATRSKFMVLRLTDFKWEIDLFLFDTGFQQFWKLTVGTVVAILNPSIMPPKPHMRDTGQFSLKLTSSDDTVIEIGMAQDLGFCKSVKRDGQECGQWIDKRHTEFCEFHINLKVERARAGRMEVNSMNSLYSDLPPSKARWKGTGRHRGAESKGGGKGHANFGGRGSGSAPTNGRWHDSFTNETVYMVPPGSGASATKLFDDEDLVDRGMSKVERQRKRLAAQEKERDLAKKLGAAGDGLGAAYIRVRQEDALKRAEAERAGGDKPRPLDRPGNAAALGLVGADATAARLGPFKGRRFGGSSTSDPLGWGGAFKRGLLDGKREDAVDTGSVDKPVLKKARLLIEKKDVRLLGRDSIPVQVDDDDDLDIV